MKKLLLPLVAISLLLLQGCCFHCTDDDGPIVEPFQTTRYEPVFLDREVFEASLTLESPQPIVETGKIYVFANLLFVNEKRKGFHVFDNSNPSNPQPVHFLNIPGATDLSVRNGIYYVNQAVDLIAVSLLVRENDLNVSKRIRNVFPEMRSPDGFYAQNIPDGSIVIDWKLKN